MTLQPFDLNAAPTDHEIEQLRGLQTLLTFMRPAGSKTESRFVQQLLQALPDPKLDGYGNVIQRIGDNPNTLWSSHTDTVHRKGGTQKVVYDDKRGLFRLAANSKSNCLGADCTTGVWLMLQMIRANVPGVYIFHREEECGGRGSDHIADKEPHHLDGIEFAIAFDRKGKSDIIIDQAGGECASEEFAEAFAKLLPPGYKSSRLGVFTDTANYAHIIPECTNISVGYESQHTANETQCVWTALLLMRTLTRITDKALRALPAQRDPATAFDDFYYTQGGVRYGGNYGGFYDSDSTQAGATYYANDTDEIYDLVQEFPFECAELLIGYGLTSTDVRDMLGLPRRGKGKWSKAS